MDDKEQTQHLADELERVINRFRTEYDITLATAVGTLNVLAFELMKEATDPEQY